jgi:hypothetical protein
MRKCCSLHMCHTNVRNIHDAVRYIPKTPGIWSKLANYNKTTQPKLEECTFDFTPCDMNAYTCPPSVSAWHLGRVCAWTCVTCYPTRRAIGADLRRVCPSPGCPGSTHIRAQRGARYPTLAVCTHHGIRAVSLFIARLAPETRCPLRPVSAFTGATRAESVFVRVA